MLVLRGGTLVDVVSGKEVPNSVWIVPGLIDSHAHAENPDEIPLSLYLANGVTTIRNPGGNITVLRLTRERLLRGEIIGPRLFFQG